MQTDDSALIEASACQDDTVLTPSMADDNDADIMALRGKADDSIMAPVRVSFEQEE